MVKTHHDDEAEKPHVSETFPMKVSAKRAIITQNGAVLKATASMVKVGDLITHPDEAVIDRKFRYGRKPQRNLCLRVRPQSTMTNHRAIAARIKSILNALIAFSTRKPKLSRSQSLGISATTKLLQSPTRAQDARAEQQTHGKLKTDFGVPDVDSGSSASAGLRTLLKTQGPLRGKP